ncbi:MAG: hypothetical protein FWH05_08770 [Oscillospiraceae bacterium]|nr:hypothetical protein [Oscillospiraceae bacterium]
MNKNTSVIEIVAQLTDQTANGAAGATANVSKLEKAMQKLQGEMARMNKMNRVEIVAHLSDKASKGIQNILSAGKKLAGSIFNVTFKAIDLVTAPLRGILGGVKSAIGGIINPILQGIGISAGMGIGSMISESVNNAGRRETMNIAMNAVARSTETDSKLLNEQKQKVMGLGIAEQEATGILTKFMQSEIDISQSSQLARIAQDAAVIAGTNSSQAAEAMVDAISGLNPALLKQFGMTRRMNDIYGDYAKSIGITVPVINKLGKTTHQLTRELEDAEKKQAILNYVMEQGEK